MKTIIALALALLVPAPAFAQTSAVERELGELRDRAEIHTLMMDYGRTIDARDFAAFGRLFARDAEYLGGGGTAAKGPEAIAAGMAAIFARNAGKTADPNFHVFFNEVITLAGETASAHSMSMFVIPGPDGRPSILMMASYDDSFVREDGRWRFKRRVVKPALPAPQSPAKPQP